MPHGFLVGLHFCLFTIFTLGDFVFQATQEAHNLFKLWMQECVFFLVSFELLHQSWHSNKSTIFLGDQASWFTIQTASIAASKLLLELGKCSRLFAHDDRSHLISVEVEIMA